MVKGSVLHISLQRHPTCRDSRREETSTVFLCTTSLTRGGSLKRTEQGKHWPSEGDAVSTVQKKPQDLWSKTHPISADRRADPWHPLEGLSQLLHWHTLTEAFMVGLATNTDNSSAPSQQCQPPPVTTPLHDEQLSNPTTTTLRVLSTQHKGFSSISSPMGLWERETQLLHLSPPTIQTALVRKNPSLTGEECINPRVCGLPLQVTLSLCFKTKPARWYSALHSHTGRTQQSLSVRK